MNHAPARRLPTLFLFEQTTVLRLSEPLYPVPESLEAYNGLELYKSLFKCPTALCPAKLLDSMWTLISSPAEIEARPAGSIARASA